MTDGPGSSPRPDRVEPRRVDGLLGLTPGVRLAAGPGGAEVAGVTLDSRLVRPGDLYVALPGRRQHGARFAGQAVAAGATAVLTDAVGAAELAGGAEPGAAVLVADDPRSAMAHLAAEVYGRPAEAMTCFAVTGTNGKTTTTFLLEAALQAAGHRVGTVGTVGYRLDGRALPAARTTVTTPEAPELQALLAHLRERGADAVAMEVSSHALALGRTDAVRFDVAAFTNFGRDHLDFHGDEESYFEAKALLFTPEHSRAVVLSIDDPRGVQLLRRVDREGDRPVRTVSVDDLGADYAVLEATSGPGGRTRVSAATPIGPLDFTLALPGAFNLRNALTALAMVELAGGDVDRAAAGLAEAAVPGRMQRVPLPPGAPLVVVDFAHTPQAVTAALAALDPQRRAGTGRTLVVLGCGGDRDRAKRGPMGAAAAAGAAVVVVTDDNPRSEDPAAIRAAVLAGARAAATGAEVLDVGDRRSAVAEALRRAGPDDVVAVLGKGHETGQEVAGRLLPFDDVAVVQQEWAEVAGPARAAGGSR